MNVNHKTNTRLMLVDSKPVIIIVCQIHPLPIARLFETTLLVVKLTTDTSTLKFATVHGTTEV